MAGLQNDVANSGLGLYNGLPMKSAGMTMSALPTGPMAKSNEALWVHQLVSPSGWNQRYGVNNSHRFSHHITLT